MFDQAAEDFAATMVRRSVLVFRDPDNIQMELSSPPGGVTGTPARRARGQ